MKKLTLIVLALAFLSACEEKKPKKYQRSFCETPEEKEKLKDFVLNCIEHANPMSDEEPEHMIEQCHESGEDIVCPVRCVYYSGHEKQLCDSERRASEKSP